MSPAWQELMIYWLGWDSELGYRGPEWHFSQALKLFFPDLVWHDWLRDRVRGFTDPEFAWKSGETTFRSISWVGAASAGKSHDASLFAVLWWMCDPANSCVILTSTSKDKIRKLGWPVVVNSWQHLKNHHNAPGHLLQSTMALQFVKGDDKHAIFGQAVLDGETQKAVERIKGQHMARILLIVDESPSTPEAIMQTINNIRKGCKEFIVISLCNAISHLDPGGMMSEPKAGWNSVNVLSDEWRTKGIPKWQVEPGICQHFDGMRSPNVRAGRTLYPFLYTFEDWQTALRTSEGQQTLQHWSNDRGFWAPSGAINTVITEQMVEKYGGNGVWGTPQGFTFLSRKTPIAALDPAFGGDECKMVFGLIGDIHGGKTGIQVTERLTIPVAVDSPDEAEVQIKNRAIKECVARGVEAEYLGIESSGTGRGSASRIIEDFGPCIRVESGGRPSDLSASDDDPRPSFEVYDRRITELKFQVKAYLVSGQLRGLYPEFVVQASAREYTVVGKKLVVATKEEVKLKLGRSPDDDDAVSVLCEVARQHGVHPGKTILAEIRSELDNAIYGNDPMTDIQQNDAFEMFNEESSFEAPQFDYYR